MKITLPPNPTPKGIIELMYLRSVIVKNVERVVNRKIIDEMYKVQTEFEHHSYFSIRWALYVYITAIKNFLSKVKK
ncbi:hypothetical protein A4G18_00625 [Pasteurellaceae bacterium Pebbles2]|nr:hypothetical protein [Pasteurellaceae bacterium Pebbles2]